LVHVREITAPLYIKINENKFVRLTHDESVFTAQTLKKYKSKNITHLYIELLTAQDFITEYKKRALSSLAWAEAGDKEGPQLIKLNTELLRNLSSRLGWNENLIDLAADHITHALQIASTHPKLSHVLSQFHKIEHYGFADHSALMVLITSGLAFQMGIADEQTLRKLTFASLIHDMQLTDDEFEHQNKIIKLIVTGKASDSRDVKNVLSHSGRSAELCRHWDFCPGVVDTIIFQHHEMPEGRGFPMGRTTDELHPLSCLFIVAEDFVNYFVDSFGEPDLAQFIKLRSKIYYEDQFKVVLLALANSLKTSIQTAS
jgi:HD-GYP domain-containing protein (c-di-GMP phosphodiesterase class II)